MRPARSRSTTLIRLLAALGMATPCLSAAEPPAQPAADLRMGTPTAYRHLTVYPILGPDAYSTGSVLTLDEALEAQQIVVHETGDVNQLAVENRSRTKTVFLQAGDIVKGGQQDRVLSSDLLLAPGSGRVPIAAFCVEAGRWSARAGERVDRFASSKHMLSSKELKLAAREARDQGAVWNQVAELQRRLSDNTGTGVASERSASSLQLSLEHDAVRDGIDAWLAPIGDLPARHPEARGFVAVLNGEINSAELYASRELFARLWPKLSRALATEALAVTPGPTPVPVPAPEAVLGFLREAESGRAEPAPAPGQRKRSTDSTLYFEAGTPELPAAHRSYLRK